MIRKIIAVISHVACAVTVLTLGAWGIIYVVNWGLTFLWTLGGIGGLEDRRAFPHRIFFIVTLCAASISSLRFLKKRARSEDAGSPAHFPDPCSVCSYDLTGNVSGICPECGTHMEAQA